MKSLTINTSTPYPIYIDENLLATSLLKTTCEQLNKRPVIITDSNLQHTYGKKLQQHLQSQGLTVDLLSFPAGEIHKTRETKQQLEDQLFAKQYGRDTCLIALGGGVVTDLVGFIAATYCRGIPVIYVPTTLLAMVDASIGGKTGVNTNHGKNLIGTFTQPHAVFIDTQTLTSLPKNELTNGIVEMIKHGLIADKELFEILKNNVTKITQLDSELLIDLIYKNCLIKKSIVEQDEQEQQGIRELLNFGHTIGHAIETLENYQLSHGEAVAIGILVESYLSIQSGILPEKNLSSIEKLLRDYGLSLQTNAFTNQQTFKETIKLDKKSIKNAARFVLLEKIGKAHYNNGYAITVNDQILDDALYFATKFLTSGS